MADVGKVDLLGLQDEKVWIEIDNTKLATFGIPLTAVQQALEGQNAMLPAGFFEYKYQVDFEDGTSRIVTDPCARYSGLSDRRSGVVIGGSRPAENTVRPLVGGRRPLTELTIYELMIDDFTAEYRRQRAPLAAA